MSRIGGRKVAVTIIMAAVGLALTALKGDIPPGLLGLMQTIFGAFVVGNAFEHISDAVSKRKLNAVIDNTPDFNYLSAKIDDLKAQNEQLKLSLTQSNESLATVQKAISFIIDKAGWGQ